MAGRCVLSEFGKLSKRQRERNRHLADPTARNKRRIKWNAANPGLAQIRNRAKNYKQYYGITIEQYDTLFAQQNGVCAICQKPETKLDRTGVKIKRLCVDHCHKTNVVRGLLCFSCNTALGHIYEDIVVLENMRKYILEFGRKVC